MRAMCPAHIILFHLIIMYPGTFNKYTNTTVEVRSNKVCLFFV
jgi:hypothetical protein